MVDSGARNESEVLELITIKDLQSEADNPTAGQVRDLTIIIFN